MGIKYRYPIPRTQQVHGRQPQVSPPMYSDLRPPHCLYYWLHYAMLRERGVGLAAPVKYALSVLVGGVPGAYAHNLHVQEHHPIHFKTPSVLTMNKADDPPEIF